MSNAEQYHVSPEGYQYTTVICTKYGHGWFYHLEPTEWNHKNYRFGHCAMCKDATAYRVKAGSIWYYCCMDFGNPDCYRLFIILVALGYIYRGE